MVKKIAILGSTGSIGKSTLQVARHLGEKVQVVALAAKSNVDLLVQQAKEFSPEIVAIFDESHVKNLQQQLPGVSVLGGMEGLIAVASCSSANIVMSAIAGTLGLEPTLAAIRAGKTVALANKEALVSGGKLVMTTAREKGVDIIPVDSEHSAIFQCLQGQQRKALKRIILTASGGPFRSYTQQQLNEISVDQALNHPTWRMGPKVTIDCSTLMNKGLEAIEAHWLFDMPVENIDVIVHPQSIIHSMVEFADGSMLAQMGEPSMIVPIQYAMTYPERLNGLMKPFDFTKHNTLQFFQPDMQKFRCLYLALEAIRLGDSFPCYMNAANEVLVQRFLQKEISWNQIAARLENLMDKHKSLTINSLDTVLAIDSQARKEARMI